MKANLGIILFNYCIICGVIILVIWLMIKTIKEFLSKEELIEFKDVHNISQSDIEIVIIDKIDKVDDWNWDFDDGWEIAKKKLTINEVIGKYDLYVDVEVMAYLNNKDEVSLRWVYLSNLSVTVNNEEIVSELHLSILKMQENIERDFK